uniref:Small ribosomal subunit protein uS15m n=1 Tax=Neovison vison TaxID=452646 RepID=A0A8C7BUL6_NEOVI
MNPLHSSFLHCYLLSISESCALYHQTLSCLPIFLNLNTTNFDHITIFCYLALGRLPVTSILRDFTIAPIPDLQFTPHIEIRGIAVRGYAARKPVQSLQEDDPPPSTLLKDYQNIPGIEKFDDVMRRLLSLEMANQKEKLKIKQQQLMNKVVANPEDTSSLEARIVALTVKIRNYEEHIIDQRKKMLKTLRKTNYSVFEKTCKELGIEYTLPPLYNRKPHRRLAAKKALCIQVFQETQKLKKQKRALKAKAAAAQKQGQKNPESPSKPEPEPMKENQ